MMRAMASIWTARGRIGYLEAGSGDATPIVFLHGVGSDKSVWRPQLEHFGKSRRAVAFDYPGYGESDLVENAGRDDFAASILAAMIDRRLWRAGGLFVIAAGLTLLGIMHSPHPGGPMFLPWQIDAATARLVWPFAVGYLGAAVVLAVCVRAVRGAASDELGEQLRFGLWLCAMLLLSPINGSYNLVLLLFPLLALLRYLELRRDTNTRNWLIVATALACWPPAWTDWQPTLYNGLHIGLGVLLLTPAFYGLALYVWLLARQLRRPIETILRQGFRQH